ncbi:MAG: ABC transporter permease [Methanomassiliicoccales archaeon]|jgi:ABC-2 type transport system permease protein
MTTRNDLPSDIEQIAITTRYELEKHFQSKAFFGIMALAFVTIALMTAVRPLLGLDFPSDAMTFVHEYLIWAPFIVLIGAVAFASGALSSEFEKRTGLLMFPQPIKRTVYLIGKFISVLIVMALVMAFYYIAASLLSLIVLGSVPATIMVSFGFVILYCMAVCGVAFLFSSLLRTGTAAIVATILTFLMVMTVTAQLLTTSGIDPFFMATKAGEAITYSLEDPYPLTHMVTDTMGGMTITSYIPSEMGAILVLLGYSIISMTIAGFMFKRRQF